MITHMTTLDDRRWTVNEPERVISGTYATAGRTARIRHDFATAPDHQSVCAYFRDHLNNWPSGTAAKSLYAQQLLFKFMTDGAWHTLNANAYSAFLSWLRTDACRARGRGALAEPTRRAVGSRILHYMRWLARRHGTPEGETVLAQRRFRKAHQGTSKRRRERLKALAISPVEYVRLLRAVRMELEYVERLLASPAEADGCHDAVGLLPAVIMLGAALAIRSAEINTLVCHDLFRAEGYLYVHAANKEPGLLWLPPGAQRALTAAIRWMDRYRVMPQTEEDAKATPLFQVRLLDDVEKAPQRFDTILVRQALARFFAKYFALRVDGVPVLFMGEPDAPHPFTRSFASFRALALTEASRHVADPREMQVLSRHKSISTTWEYYIRKTHHEWLTNVTLAMRASEEHMRIATAGTPVATAGVAEVAAERGALVKGGHCQRALSGDTACVRATDCRLCDNFVIHEGRRDFFEYERDCAQREADMLMGEAGCSRDVEGLRQQVALNQAIIDRIDDESMATV